MSLTCAELEDLAAELALGTVSGSERAAALDHLAGCAACRDLVDQLARVSDSLLLLAPVAEPPPGFESKVLSRLGVAPAPVRHSTRRRRRVLVGVAAAVMVAGLSGGGAVLLAGGEKPPVEAAAGVRTALATDVNGHWTCRAVVYGEHPTWLVVSLDRTDDLSATFSVEAVHAGDDAPVPVGTFTIDQGHGSLAKAVPLPAADLRSIRVLDGGGKLRYEMNFAST